MFREFRRHDFHLMFREFPGEKPDFHEFAKELVARNANREPELPPQIRKKNPIELKVDWETFLSFTPEQEEEFLQAGGRIVD